MTHGVRARASYAVPTAVRSRGMCLRGLRWCITPPGSFSGRVVAVCRGEMGERVIAGVLSPESRFG